MSCCACVDVQRTQLPHLRFGGGVAVFPLKLCLSCSSLCRVAGCSHPLPSPPADTAHTVFTQLKSRETILLIRPARARNLTQQLLNQAQKPWLSFQPLPPLLSPFPGALPSSLLTRHLCPSTGVRGKKPKTHHLSGAAKNVAARLFFQRSLIFPMHPDLFALPLLLSMHRCSVNCRWRSNGRRRRCAVNFCNSHFRQGMDFL